MIEALTKVTLGFCSNCGLLRRIRMYLLEDGSRKWLCSMCKQVIG